ncbi:MAG: hypothetical protein JRH09_06150 [Deltaproteobacteria bacterium]|nr:hypothetical protein [Deltaproteobacteria bacterium]
MKVKSVFAFVSAVCVFFLTTSFLSAESESRGSPSAYFPTDQYEFDQTLEGNDVRHDLVVQNKGECTA